MEMSRIWSSACFYLSSLVRRHSCGQYSFVGRSYKMVKGQTFLYSHPSQDNSVTTGWEKPSFGSLSLFSLLSTNLVDNSSIWNYYHPSDWTFLSTSFMWFTMNIKRQGDNHCNLFPGSKVDMASMTVCGLSVCSLVSADIQHLNSWLKVRQMLNMQRVHIATRKRRCWWWRVRRLANGSWCWPQYANRTKEWQWGICTPSIYKSLN
jgi:hypothetical protein